MKKTYLNPLRISQRVILSRLHSIEPLASVETFVKYFPKEVDGRPVPGEDLDIAIIESDLPDEQINSLLSLPQTSLETDSINEYITVAQEIRSEYVAAMAKLQEIQTLQNPTNAEVLQWVRFEARVQERILKLLKILFS